MRWEYTTRYHQPDLKQNVPILEDMVTEANELGQDGWELVSVTADADRDGRTRGYLYYFKRPKP
jgi:hypothetical protein